MSTPSSRTSGRSIPRYDIADNVATLVSRLRATLGPEVVLGGRGGYRLGGPPAVTVDLDQAAALAAEAERRLATGDPTLAGAAARHGLELLRDGQVLVGEPRADWVDAAQAEAGMLLRTLRHRFAAAALAAGDPGAAIAVARAAAADDALDERAHQLLMAAHHADGEPGRSLAVYERLRTALADELGVDPAPETRALHVAILRGEPAGTAPAPPATVARRQVPAGRRPSSIG